MSALLEVQNLSVSFKTRRGELTAVDDLSLSINKGEILGLVGESGAGKSMTGSAIIGLIDPPGRISAGAIYLHGQRVDHAAARLRGKSVGMIFQDPLTSLNPLRSIGSQLVETILTHLPLSSAQAIELAHSTLTEVGIDPDRFNSYPHMFSGGMRQRVVIALAIVTNPELIIADEPTTALDVSVQAQILELLQRLCRSRGSAVLLITHDMGVIAEVTDRVAVLYAGRLMEIGATRSVLTEPQHPYTQGLMASTPSVDPGMLDKMLYQIPGAMPKLDALPTGCAYHPRCEHASERCRQRRPELFANRVACWLAQAPETAI